jgi:hypothetical protein
MIEVNILATKPQCIVNILGPFYPLRLHLPSNSQNRARLWIGVIAIEESTSRRGPKVSSLAAASDAGVLHEPVVRLHQPPLHTCQAAALDPL